MSALPCCSDVDQLGYGEHVHRPKLPKLLTRGQWGLSMLTSERRNGLDRNGGPLARAETGGPGTGPRPAAPRPTEPSDPIGGARASHCIHPDLPRGGNAAVHLNWVASERSTSRMNSAAAYSKANVDFSAMAAGRHGDHEPVSVELGRICGRSGTDDCESGRHSEGAHTNANHGSPHTSFYLRARFAQRARNVLMEQCDEFQAHLAPQRTACALALIEYPLRSGLMQGDVTATRSPFRVKRTAPPEILIFLL